MSANRRLWDAAMQGDLAGVQQALADGANISNFDEQYYPPPTALHHASR